jgi:hypothetical protein
MTDASSAPSILALHLGLLEAHAAVDRAGRIDLVALGDDRAGMPMVLHVSTEGDVTVGEEALRRATVEPGGLIDNVMGRLLDDGFVEASGRTLPAETVLAHLLAQAYARCLRVLDGVPDQVVVVRAAEVQQLVVEVVRLFGGVRDRVEVRVEVGELERRLYECLERRRRLLQLLDLGDELLHLSVEQDVGRHVSPCLRALSPLSRTVPSAPRSPVGS